MAEALILSTEQVVARVDLFGKTARLVQPTNGRKIEFKIGGPVVGGKADFRSIGRGDGSSASRSTLADTRFPGQSGQAIMDSENRKQL